MPLEYPIFARILGQVVREAREARGWTRLELAQRLPSGIGERTLLSYEHGIRALSVDRFVEICRALGMSASDLLTEALYRDADIRGLGIPIRVGDVANDTTRGFKAVQRWATRLLATEETPETLLSGETIGALALAFDIDHKELAQYLIGFSPYHKSFALGR